MDKHEYVKSNETVPQSLQEQRDEFMKAAEDYMPDGRVLKKTREVTREEKSRQLRKLKESLETPFGYKVEDGEIRVDPHQARYLQLRTELFLLELRDSEIEALFREMSITKFAREGYDLNEHYNSIIECGKELLQERLTAEEGQSKE